MKYIFLFVSQMLLVSCLQFEAEVANEDKNQLLRLTNRIDGEVVVFNTNAIYNFTGSLVESSFQVIDCDGNHHRFNNQDTPYWRTERLGKISCQEFKKGLKK